MNLLTSRRTVTAHIQRWRVRVVRRMKARDGCRPLWDRQQFLEEYWADFPGDTRATEIADAFEAAIAQAHGNPARFEQGLDRLLASLKP